MNYLAHAYLSFGLPGVLTGNMISDFVKGRKQFDYPAEIRKGITLHRAIDEFTDFHPVTQEAKVFFRPAYRLYSGAFIDIVYDHFLANDRRIFSTEKQLLNFTVTTYEQLDADRANFPLPFAGMFPYMKAHNWLYNYRHREGIQRSFQGLVRRSQYLNESDLAHALFIENHTALGELYAVFFPELELFVKEWLNKSGNLS